MVTPGRRSRSRRPKTATTSTPSTAWSPNQPETAPKPDELVLGVRAASPEVLDDLDDGPPTRERALRQQWVVGPSTVGEAAIRIVITP